MMRAVSLENHNFLKSEVDFYCINCDFLTAKEKKEALFDFFYCKFSYKMLFSKRAKKITLN